MKIAVIGIGCRYPGAHSAKALYENVLSGRRAFRSIPKQRWSIDDYYHPDKKNADTTYCKKAAVIDGFKFNPADYRIPRATWLATDIAQWMALQVSKEALEDAGVDPGQNQTTGVIVGNTLTGEITRAGSMRYRWPYVARIFSELLDELNIAGTEKSYLLDTIEARYKAPFPDVNEDNLAGSLSNTIAGRICNYFDFKGGGFTTDGACSSSLLAINQACIGLVNNACDLALAGGVDISLDPFEMVGFAKVGALSDSDIRVYDHFSNGFLPGEGCGMVVLQRHEDALAQGKKIYAVIQGIGISSDGNGGITAPSVIGQSLAVQRAYEMADYAFSDVELIEGHGTGTPTGDRVELTTFIENKKSSGASPEHRCGIGSVKSNIGHTKAAAGVAGFIKAVMSVCHGLIPATQGIQRPNRLFAQSAHLYPILRGRIWPGDGPRRAAVSSAGFGGINTHITFSSDDTLSKTSPEEQAHYASMIDTGQSSEVIFVAAESLDDMREQVKELRDVAEKISYAELADLSYYCSKNLTSNRIRLAIVADYPESLFEKLTLVAEYLRQVSSEHDMELIDRRAQVYLYSRIRQPRIAYLFPGQASQHLNMARCLYARSEIFRQILATCEEILAPKLGISLRKLIYCDTDNLSREQEAALSAALNDTAMTQPAVSAISIACVHFLRELGIRPDLAIGHSLGEYSALYSAGALDLSEAMDLVAKRGRAMAGSSAVEGAMLSVGLDREHTQKLIDKQVLAGGELLVISNINSPGQTIVSGTKEAVLRLAGICEVQEIRSSVLPVSTAFHSTLMAKAADEMSVELRRARFSLLRHLVVSSSTGGFYFDPSRIPDMLSKQILAPVDFIGAIQTSAREDVDIYIEVGPGAVLSGLTRAILGDAKAGNVKAGEGKTDDGKKGEGNTAEGKTGEGKTGEGKTGEHEAAVFSMDIGDRGQYSEGLNQLVAYLFACGNPLNMQKIFEGRFLRDFSLPYKKQFIESPCELTVAPLSLSLKVGSGEGRLFELDPTLLQAREEAMAVLPDTASSDGPEGILALFKKQIVKDFGYPEEMITAESGFQNDLGLDSLKSVELIYEVMGAVGVRSDASALSGKSIREISHSIYQLKMGKAVEPAGDASIISTPQPDWVSAFDSVLEPTVELSMASVDKALLRGQSILVAYEEKSDLVDALSKALVAAGARVTSHPVDAKNHFSGKSGGCIYVANKRETLAECLDVSEEGIAQKYVRPRAMLALAQQIIKSGHNSPQCFLLIAAEGNSFWRGENANHALAGTGFVKTLGLENPAIATGCLDLDKALPVTESVDIIVAEYLLAKGHTDAAYDAGRQRSLLHCYPVAPACYEERAHEYRHEDIILITGGARGITAECALALGKATGARLALVGSSAVPAADSQSDIVENLQRFADAGIRCDYFSCNISNPVEVAALITNIQNSLGQITGLLHAAGVNNLQKIATADWQSYQRVIAPKYIGLINLMNSLELATIKSVMVFSSVIANSGMSGNAEYAFANDCMNQLVKRLTLAYPQVDFQAYGFSVWSDIGMGARHGSTDLLANMGINAIPVADGCAIFSLLASRCWDTSNLVISSRMGSLGTLQFSESAIPENSFSGELLYLQPGIEIIREIALHPERDRYLDDHVYEGSRLFPAVMGIEAMVQACVACRASIGIRDDVVPVLENLVFERAVIVPGKGRPIRVYAQLHPRDKNGDQKASVVLRSSASNYTEDYFSAECVWYSKKSKAKKKGPPKGDYLALSPRKDLYGHVLFQGSMFQNIVGYKALTPTHCIVDIQVPAKTVLFSQEAYNNSIYFGSGQIRDAFLHAVQLCVPEYRILPIAIEQIRYYEYEKGEKSSPITLYARERERSENEFLYDLEAYDSQHRCVEQMHGFRCRIMGNYEDVENLEKIRRVQEKYIAVTEVENISV